MSDLYPHQREAADKVLAILRDKGIVYLAALPRTGKTRTSLTVAKEFGAARVLFVTKKQAIPGICSEAAALKVSPTVTNFEQVEKLTPSDYDFVIVDEAHNVGRAGKPSQRFKHLRRLVGTKPLLLLSGTPNVESAGALFYQFAISHRTPFKHGSFFDFFREYGIPSPMRLHGRDIETYKRYKPEVLDIAEPYFVRLTQADAGIKHQVQDNVHRVPLAPDTLALLREVSTGVSDTLGTIFDSDSAIRAAMHQIETGAVLLDGKIALLSNNEVMDYIRTTFGDSPDVAVMAHYRSTREKIAQCLPNVHVYSSDGASEGVDLSHYKHFVIVNTGYSGAKHVQRRERINNLNNDKPRTVHIVTAGKLSQAVYTAVSRKLDFNLAMFRKEFKKRA